MFEIILCKEIMTPLNDRFFMTSFVGNNDVITCHLGRRYCINFYSLVEYKSHVRQEVSLGHDKVKI